MNFLALPVLSLSLGIYHTQKTLLELPLANVPHGHVLDLGHQIEALRVKSSNIDEYAMALVRMINICMSLQRTLRNIGNWSLLHVSKEIAIGTNHHQYASRYFSEDCSIHLSWVLSRQYLGRTECRGLYDLDCASLRHPLDWNNRSTRLTLAEVQVYRIMDMHSIRCKTPTWCNMEIPRNFIDLDESSKITPFMTLNHHSLFVTFFQLGNDLRGRILFSSTLLNGIVITDSPAVGLICIPYVLASITTSIFIRGFPPITWSAIIRRRRFIIKS